MTQSASQAGAFYRDVAASGIVWTIEDERGYPAPVTSSGRRSMPFWSSRSRAEKIVKTVGAYAGFRPVQFTWQEFVASWVPELSSLGQLVGVNWSGKLAVGYDIEPEDVVRNVQHEIASTQNVVPFHRPRVS